MVRPKKKGPSVATAGSPLNAKQDPRGLYISTEPFGKSVRAPEWRRLSPIERWDWLDTIFGEATPTQEEIVLLRDARAHLCRGVPLSRALRATVDAILLAAWNLGVRV